MKITPTSPLLVIRPGVSFWIHDGDPERGSATLQAFLDGCFEGALYVDGSGGMWPITDAVLSEEPSSVDGLLPWRRLPVALRTGEKQEVSHETLVALLSAVLRGNQAFGDQLRIPADRFTALLEQSESVADVLDLVRAHMS